MSRARITLDLGSFPELENALSALDRMIPHPPA